MNFLERIFHIWPDHGDGTLEALIFAILAALVACAVVRTISANRTNRAWRAAAWKFAPGRVGNNSSAVS